MTAQTISQIFELYPEQVAWLQRQAEKRRKAKVDIIREWIDAQIEAEQDGRTAPPAATTAKRARKDKQK